MFQSAEIIYGEEDRPIFVSREATTNSKSVEEDMLGKNLVTINAECEEHLKTLRKQLMEVLKSKPPQLLSDPEESTYNYAQPLIWIIQWVDYSNKYGFGYQLCNLGIGIMFLDQTRLLLLADQKNLHYIESDGIENYYTMDGTPSTLKAKVKILTHFQKFMAERLGRGITIPVQEFDQFGRILYLQKWRRSESNTIMQLSNGTLQINFGDHKKIAMCPLMRAVAFDDGKNYRTYGFSTIMKNGCNPGLSACLEFACKEIENLLEMH